MKRPPFKKNASMKTSMKEYVFKRSNKNDKHIDSLWPSPSISDESSVGKMTESKKIKVSCFFKRRDWI